MEKAAARSLKWLLAAFAFGFGMLVAAIAIPIETVQIVLGIGFVFVGLPVIVVCAFDAQRAVRDSPNASVSLRVVGLSLAIPQALFGLASILMGASVIAWVAYNTFVQRMPQYKGGPVPFLGVGPLFVIAGWWWLRSAFERDSGSRIAEDDVPGSTSPGSEPFD